MQIEIVHGPGNSAARVHLDKGEQLTAESGAMIAMSGDMDVTTTTHKRSGGGMLKAVKRKLGGESFFLNHYVAPTGGEVLLATSLPGDMLAMALEHTNLIVQSGSYVASAEGIEVDLGWQGFKSLFSGEGMFWLRLSGQGHIVLSSFGAIYPIEVDGEYVVDTGHIVAFDDTLDFSLSKAGSSWLHSILGGEGLVCRFKGKGTVWCQSHQPRGFGLALRPHLRPVG
ncbi:MAG: TIGR00266 family protein [Xanthomonadales bacterium]|nr:TIGR00266 family protein [Xanthomonadales bacterium]